MQAISTSYIRPIHVFSTGQPSHYTFSLLPLYFIHNIPDHFQGVGRVEKEINVLLTEATNQVKDYGIEAKIEQGKNRQGIPVRGP